MIKFLGVVVFVCGAVSSSEPFTAAPRSLTICPRSWFRASGFNEALPVLAGESIRVAGFIVKEELRRRVPLPWLRPLSRLRSQQESTIEFVNRSRACPNRRDPCSNEDRLCIRGCCVRRIRLYNSFGTAIAAVETNRETGARLDAIPISIYENRLYLSRCTGSH
jgi:hypothetical protein